MKNYLLTVVVFAVGLNLVNGQDDKIMKTRSCWQTHDRAINAYADSLNYLSDDNKLPAYLNDYLVDWRFRKMLYQCLKKTDEVISQRKAIIDRVYREDVLNLIINSGNKNYDKCYEPVKLKNEMGKKADFESFPDIRYMDQSWRDLAKKRLREISAKKEQFKGK